MRQDDVPSATPEQLADLAAILARSEFQAARQRSLLAEWLAPFRDWLTWLFRELGRWLSQWLGWGFETGGDGLSLAVVLLAMAVSLVVVVGAALIARRLIGGSVVRDAALADLGVAGAPRASDELARARELARAGDMRRAVHHQYRAVLLRLDERDHLPFDGALTNRELLPRLTAAPELSRPFAELVSRFDRLWYGQTDCSAEEYAAFAELAERVWHAAGSVPPTRSDRTGLNMQPLPVGASSRAR